MSLKKFLITHLGSLIILSRNLIFLYKEELFELIVVVVSSSSCTSYKFKFPFLDQIVGERVCSGFLPGVK